MKDSLTDKELNQLVASCFEGIEDAIDKVWIDYLGGWSPGVRLAYLRMTFPRGVTAEGSRRAKLLAKQLQIMTGVRFVVVMYLRDMTWEQTDEVTARIRHVGIAG